ncbi:MAG: DUF2771 family protein [Nakamurella sp.]
MSKHRLLIALARTKSTVAVLIAVIALSTILLAGCSRDANVAGVTVTVGSTAVTLPAAASCISLAGATELSCAGSDNDDAAPHLAISPGTPLTIEVPSKVGDTPWVVVFSYVDTHGTKQGDRTAVFPPKKQYSYRLTPPAGAQLTRVEVQSLTAAPRADGGIEFPAIGTWVLVIDPIGGASPTSGQKS